MTQNENETVKSVEAAQLPALSSAKPVETQTELNKDKPKQAKPNHTIPHSVEAALVTDLI